MTPGWGANETIHADLRAAKARVYDALDIATGVPVMEAESADYGAYALSVEGLSARFRVAKITPTKVGQFVTLWKRIGKGPIAPFDMSDPIELFVVSVRSGEHFGQFVFPKSVLGRRAIVSVDGAGGKRAMRVYPPWDVTTSGQAARTQAWQLDFFLPIPAHGPLDAALARRLYRGQV